MQFEKKWLPRPQLQADVPKVGGYKQGSDEIADQAIVACVYYQTVCI